MSDDLALLIFYFASFLMWS